MTLPSFPPRLRSHHRAHATPVQRDMLRRYFAGALLGAAVVVIALVLLGVVSGWALIPALIALSMVPLARWGSGLFETVAPLPDVHTAPVTGADITALAEDVGVLRVGAHSVRALAEADTATTAIPQVQA